MRTERWSTLPGNEALPDRVKELIDTAEFQARTAAGLADLAAGRGRTLEEFRERYSTSTTSDMSPISDRTPRAKTGPYTTPGASTT